MVSSGIIDPVFLRDDFPKLIEISDEFIKVISNKAEFNRER